MLSQRQTSESKLEQDRHGRYHRAVGAMKDFFQAMLPQGEHIDFRLFDGNSLFDKVTKDNSKWENSIALMENLVKLKNALIKHKETKKDFFVAGYKSWIKAVELTQRLLYNSNCATGQAATFLDYRTPLFGYGEKGITCFSDTISKTIAVVDDPEDLNKWNSLSNSVEKTRRQVEGFFIYRKEHRLLAGFVGTLSFLFGVALFVGGILLDPITLGGSTAMILAGTAVMAASAPLIMKAIKPGIDKPSELIHEEECSHEFAELVARLRCTSFDLM